jgi:prepilin-type N-terminal cleavage/methylation domain-containing protein
MNSKGNNKGFSLVELLIVIVILGIIASISVLNITSSRRAANSASAVQSLRVITTSQASYSTGAGNGNYATSEDLLKGEYIDNSLASATLPTPTNVNQQPKSGYLFVFETSPSDAITNRVANFQISARPLIGTGLARAGDKSFFVDSTGVIRVSPSPIEPFADANSQPIN